METYEALEAKEWLITNGLGGYASASVAGANTRRYHGLLVAARNPPTDRQVLVSKIEETVLGEGGPVELSSNRYGTESHRRTGGPDVIHPQGWTYLVSFERMPLPCWTYQTDNQVLVKRICMVQGLNVTVVSYQNAGQQAITLRLNPLFVYRDYHSLYHENPHSDYSSNTAQGGLNSMRTMEPNRCMCAFRRGRLSKTGRGTTTSPTDRNNYAGLIFRKMPIPLATSSTNWPQGRSFF